jgi:hypothetical protein
MGVEMSPVSRGESRTAHAAVETYVASADPHGAGLYLTNEVFLYRVVGVSASDLGELVELEDCYSLDVVHVPVRHLRERRLRVVTAGPVQH